MMLSFEVPEEVILDLAAQIQADKQENIDAREYKALRLEIHRLTRETRITEANIGKIGASHD